MKNVILFHGAGESPQSFWYPYVKKELEKSGYLVSIPQLPDTDKPDLKKWLPSALEEKYTEETILIGHSSGCPLILSVLENIKVKIKQAILISGFFMPISEGPNAILKNTYNWSRIKENVNDIIFINSDNDPWGCDDRQGRKMLDNVGKGKLIIMKGEGHMGSNKFSQPYKEFSFLIKLID